VLFDFLKEIVAQHHHSLLFNPNEDDFLQVAAHCLEKNEENSDNTNPTEHSRTRVLAQQVRQFPLCVPVGVAKALFTAQSLAIFECQVLTELV
jgi:hypothetical protein